MVHDWPFIKHSLHQVPFYYLLLACTFFFFWSFCLVFVMFSCSRWSFVGVLVTFSCSADYVRNWQPRILLGMVDARWVSVKNTTTTLDKQHEKMLSQVFVFSI